jgi:hypothetical protein
MIFRPVAVGEILPPRGCDERRTASYGDGVDYLLRRHAGQICDGYQ